MPSLGDRNFQLHYNLTEQLLYMWSVIEGNVIQHITVVHSQSKIHEALKSTTDGTHNHLSPE